MFKVSHHQQCCIEKRRSSLTVILFMHVAFGLLPRGVSLELQNPVDVLSEIFTVVQVMASVVVVV